MSLATRLRALESSGRYAVREETDFQRAERLHFERTRSDPELVAICAERRALYVALGIDPDDLRACLDAMTHPEVYRLTFAQRRRDIELRRAAGRWP